MQPDLPLIATCTTTGTHEVLTHERNRQHMYTHTNRSKLMMNLMIHEELARAQMSERLGEARELRRQRDILRSRKISRRAERAAQQARLALARSIAN